MSRIEQLRSLLQDRWALHISAYTAYRYSLIDRFLISGPVRSLNIGSGGGIETVRLLRRGNHVTTVDIDEEGAARTHKRVMRSGFGDRHVGIVGHVLNVAADGPFDFILMSEVLEHIEKDFDTLRRLAGWLVPGGRLILTTPTASYGQMVGDTLAAKEDIEHHVRVGYDGPELDEMLNSVGLLTLRREYHAYALVRMQVRVERKLRLPSLWPVGATFALASRPLMPALDAALPMRPLTQLTLATKRRPV